jgi:hypothetical protein
MELAVAVVVKMVVEVDVAVAGGVPFGHPHPPKMSTIILITLSDKVIVLKNKILSIILLHSHNNLHHSFWVSHCVPPFLVAMIFYSVTDLELN